MRRSVLAPIRDLCCALVCTALLLSSGAARSARAQEIWEYTPYKICVWFALDPSLDTSVTARDALVQRTTERLESTFGAAWDITPLFAPPNLHALIERGPDQLVVENFSNTDLVLVLNKDDPETKTLRVLESAVQQLSKIGITTFDRQQMEIDSQPFTSHDEVMATLLEKSSELFDTYSDLAAALRENRIRGALIPRGQLKEFAEVARSVASILPWHTESTLREYDKLFIVHCEREAESYHLAVRELDCPMRLFGPTVHASTVSWKTVANLAADSIIRAFAPVARIEEANGKVVQLRNRAGGMASDLNPVLIQPGDVLQPVIRKEDRRGAAIMLEPIPWTYIGVTSTDGINIEGTSYSALGNILQGKQTRRAQRVALRVRPMGDYSDVKIVVRTDPSQAQPGCQIYQRDLLTEELRFVGHTDWRGIIRINRPEPLGGILPESERLKRVAARKAAAEAAEAAELAAAEAARQARAESGKGDNAEPQADQRAPAADGEAGASKLDEPIAAAGAATSGTSAAAQAATEEVDPAAGSVPLRQPFVLLYVKSGDTVLARLPVVPGLNPVDVADLPSDARRLEAEAVLRGFQSEILDLIAKRALLGARVSHALSEKKFDEAQEVIGQVRRLPDYNAMADKLDGLQRRLLDESEEAIPMAAKSRIDRMTQTTRDMLQKYLENDLVPKLDRDLKNAQAAAVEEAKTAEKTAEKAAAEAAQATEAEKSAEGAKPASGTPTAE